ncbi:PD40 domain-containing protein [candidate division KSB1 bacterium]|nr:PD40 domain-containing protein [candidate division KSB1 bacterium]MBL7094777.1 PD40 domain-containing protein [candidate division KSB1 bacterium]
MIRSIDVEKATVSLPIIELKNRVILWFRNGLTYSPDGNYLVYPDRINENVELVALPVENYGTTANGSPIQITALSGIGEPFWPCFDKNGKLLSYGVGLLNKDFYIASLQLNETHIGKSILPIVTNKGRIDRDAIWSPDGKIIAFLSDKWSQTDIFVWNRKNNQFSKREVTAKPEKNLKFSPDGSELSYLSEGCLWKTPILDGENKKLYPDKNKKQEITIHSFDWGFNTDTLYAVLSQRKGKNQCGYMIKITFSNNEIDTLISEIFHPQLTEIYCSPQKNIIALRRLDQSSPEMMFIQLFDLVSKEIKNLPLYSAIIPNGEMSWSSDGKSIVFGTYENDESTLTFYSVSLGGILKSLSISSFEEIQALRPGQISPLGDEIIIYKGSRDTDIWMIGEQ